MTAPAAMGGRGGARIFAELGVWLILAAAAYGLSFEFADEPGTYLWGAASWPRAVILLVVLGALAQAAVRLRRRATGHDGPAVAAEGIRRGPGKRVRFVASLALPFLYVFVLPRAGFYVTTPVFLAVYLALLGERRPMILVVAPLVIFALVNLVFTKLFYVALPTGTWPGFYDASNWFLVTVR